jgi:hypothetical protein
MFSQPIRLAQQTRVGWLFRAQPAASAVSAFFWMDQGRRGAGLFPKDAPNPGMAAMADDYVPLD